ncbi:MAG: hypothetical protein LWW94_05785 [Candidatus Desulfofervidaceae bacterium]|nr:hypothetical protein [Candidatus Desulfofervidaceae bacterium]
MKKYLIYWEDDKIYTFHEGEKRQYSLEAFTQNPPQGTGVLLLSDEKVLQKVIALPTGEKLNLSQIMLHETLELVQIEQVSELKKEFIFNWRSLGKGEGKEFYLLMVFPKKDLLPFFETWKQKRLAITDVVCNVDLLIKIGEISTKKPEDYFLFFNQNIVYFLAFQEGRYVFHRKFELTDLPTSDSSWEEFFLELKRSIFYVKQKYKLIPTSITLLAPPSWFSPYVNKLQAELDLMVSSLSLKEAPCPEIPFLNLFITYSSLVPSLISFLSPEILFERKLKKYSLVMAIVFLFIFIWSYWGVFYYGEMYQKEMNEYLHTLILLNQVKKRIGAHRERINYLRNLQKQTEEVKRLLDKRFFVYDYLQIFSYILPPQIHLERVISIRARPKDESHPLPVHTLIINGKIDVKDPQKRNEAFQAFIARLEKCPFIMDLNQVDTDDMLKEGVFKLEMSLKRVKP